MIHKKAWFKRTIIAAALVTSAGISCAQAAVLTSIRPLGFIASAIADGVTTTEVLLPDGASPHDYALKPSDIKRLREADLVVWVGPEMEAFLTKPVQQLENNKNLMLTGLPAVHSLLMAGDDDDDHDHKAHAAESNVEKSENLLHIMLQMALRLVQKSIMITIMGNITCIFGSLQPLQNR